MAQVGPEAQRREAVADPGQLQHDLQRCAEQKADRHRGYVKPPGQQHRGDHDPGVEDRGAKGRERKTLERVQQAGQHAGQAHQHHGRKHQPQQIGGLGLGVRVVLATEEAHQCRRQQDQHSHQRADPGRRHRQHGAGQAPELPTITPLGSVGAEHRDKRRIDKTAGHEVVHLIGHSQRQLQGVDVRARAKQPGLDRLTDVAEHAARDIAQGDPGGAARNVAG